MVKLKIFLMAKNEPIFIEDWIIYHGYLFGLENLHIVDGSDEPEVLAVYEFYKEHGLNVHYSSSGLNELAGEITGLMHQYKDDDSFLIKMDADEFLAYTNPAVLRQRFSIKSFRGLFRNCVQVLKGKGVDHHIDNYDIALPNIKDLSVERFDEFFESLPVTEFAYKANYGINNIPSDRPVTRATVDITQFGELHATDFKSFFHSRGFCEVDLGGHRGRVKNKKKLVLTGLVIIHYVHPTRLIYAQRAKKVLTSHGFLEPTDSLELQVQKLSRLVENGETLSAHKIHWYLDYLFASQSGDDMQQNTDSSQRGNALNLVRDKVARIRKLGSFPCQAFCS